MENIRQIKRNTTTMLAGKYPNLHHHIMQLQKERGLPKEI